jgi:NAD(P)H dehydrogenase (quinone)
MSGKILVTGASGQLGRRIVHHLLESQHVDPARIIAVTRDPAKLADLAARGVLVRAGDFKDPASLATAFDGAAKVLIVSGVDVGQRLAQHKAAVDAAVSAGVQRLAYTSMPNPEPGNRVLFADEHYGTEQAIKATGLPHTIYRVSWYQENLLGSLPPVLASGQWYTSTDDGRVAHVARDDAAAAIAGGLAADETGNRTYTLTGPAALTTAEIAALASRVLGRNIAVVQLSDEQLAEGMKQAGLPESVIPLLVSFEANTRAGGIDIVTDDVASLSGRAPRSMESFFAANRQALAG